MNLAASLIIRNERHRYLKPCVDHLLEFCDLIVIWDNGSTDDWEERVRFPLSEADHKRVKVWYDEHGADPTAGSMFLNHATARQALCARTVAYDPDWILAIDADEFIADGQQLRAACERATHPVLRVCLQEVWNADEETLELRQDGGWVEHDVGLLWSPRLIPSPGTIIDRGPATGRTPHVVSIAAAGHACTALMHFGWANRQERADRHHRYAVADGGRYHSGPHLDSILWPDDRVTLNSITWPTSLLPYRAAILAHARP